MSVNVVTKTGTTYNVGGVSKTQNNLNNNMSGTDANAIYYATHGGSGATAYNKGNQQSSNPGSYVTYNTKQDVNVGTPDIVKTNTDTKSGGGGSNTQAQDPSSSFDYNAYINGLVEQQRQRAQQSYEDARARLDEAYNRTRGALADNLNSTSRQLGEQFNYGSDILNRDKIYAKDTDSIDSIKEVMFTERIAIIGNDDFMKIGSISYID